MKNKLESIFRNSIKQYPWYYLKLQVNQLAHCKTPADYIVLTERYKYLVECKQVLLKDEKGRFCFDRLTQENDLIYFQNRLESNKSFILISFLNKRIKDSYFFLIDIISYLNFRKIINKKSANLVEFNKYLGKNKIQTSKSKLIIPFE